MRNVMRTIFLLFPSLVLLGELQAHNVVWLENRDGASPTNPLVAYFPPQAPRYVNVYPLIYADGSYEPCIVQVNLDPQTSPLVHATVIQPNPANQVQILIQVLGYPANHSETVILSGEWHATGSPDPNECTSTSPTQFTVPVTVSDEAPPTRISIGGIAWYKLDTGFPAFLQSSQCVTGPWETIGFGQQYSVLSRMRDGFLQRFMGEGGYISGWATDPQGNVIQGLGADLRYGGSPAVIDSFGNYGFDRMAPGKNGIVFSRADDADDEEAEEEELEVEADATTNTAINWTMDWEDETNAPPPTNLCNCTPWCAIAVGSAPGGLTPVYYSGGANSAPGSSGTCEAEVTVTPPSGPSYSITPGTGHRQSSPPDPAAGVWSVTATVCGQTKTASITVSPPGPFDRVNLRLSGRFSPEVICGKPKTAAVTAQ
jgi:hypothetical protein